MDQLDLFLSTYMSLGSTVSVEYGWSYHQNYGSTYEAISGDIVGSFKAMQERVAQGGGDYDGFVGLVSNYNFKAMPKAIKTKKKVSKNKSKEIKKTPKKTTKSKKIDKVPIKISKTYAPKETEKYMCDKHKVFFRMKLQEWKKELVKANNEALYNGSVDDNSISADIVDQASSYTDKNVEMKAINRQIKLISEIDKALARIREDTYGYCLDTAEPIGLKRLMARPVAKYTIAAQEKHEKDEKVHADD